MVNLRVRLRKDSNGNVESCDDLIRRFKKACLKAGIIKDYKKHDFFVKKSIKRKLKSEEYRRSLKRK
jgi:small subunit ribosomal protein S21